MYWGIFCLSMLLLGIQIAFERYGAYWEIDRHEIERIGTLTRVIDANLVVHLEAIDLLLTSVRDELQKPAADTKPDWNTLSAKLTIYAESTPGARSMSFFDATGTVVASSRRELIGRNFADRAYFQTALTQHNSNVLYASEPFRTVLNAYGMQLTRVVVDSQGAFNGIVVVTLDADFFTTLLKAVSYAPDVRATLVHESGTVFRVIPENSIPDGTNLAKPGSLLVRHLESGQHESLLKANSFSTGDYRLAVLRTLKSEKLPMDKALVIVVSRNMDAVYAEWTSKTRLILFYFGLLLFLGAGGIAMYLRQLRLSWEERAAQSRAARVVEETFIAKIQVAQRSLEQKQHQLHTVLANSPNGLIMFDRERHVVFYNERYLSLLGFPRELLAQPDIRFDDLLSHAWQRGDYPGSSQEQVLAHFVGYFEARELVHFQRQGRHGKTLEIYGIPIPDGGTLLSYLDITASKQAEAERIQVTKELEDLYEHAPCGYHSLDQAGHLIRINHTELLWLGYQREELIGKVHIADILTAESCQIFQDNFPRFKASGKLLNLELEMLRKDGSVMPVLVNATAVYDKDGAYKMSRTTVFDRTESKILEAQLQQRTRDAEAANQSKSDFLANISHEIRTPMNAIIGLTNLVLESELSTRQRDRLGKVSNSAKALLRLLNDILDHAKLEAGQLAIESMPFQLHQVVQEVHDLFAYRMEEKCLYWRQTIEADIPKILVGDALRLGQVLINLVGNAIKFTEHGGVMLQIGLDAIEESIVKLRFSVTDTGVGMTPTQCDRVFDAFVQADSSVSRKYGGTGLGLSITRQIVDLMHGTIDVTSLPGQGSTFTFTVAFATSKMPDERIASNAGPTNASLQLNTTSTVLSDQTDQRPLTEQECSLVGQYCDEMMRQLASNNFAAKATAEKLEALVLGTVAAPTFQTVINAIRRLQFREASELLRDLPSIIFNQEGNHE